MDVHWFPSGHDYYFVWNFFQQNLKYAGLDIRDKEEYGLIGTTVPEIFVSISLFEVYFCLFVHSYNYQHDVYKNKPRFASKIQLKRTRKNIF